MEFLFFLPHAPVTGNKQQTSGDQLYIAPGGTLRGKWEIQAAVEILLQICALNFVTSLLGTDLPFSTKA